MAALDGTPGQTHALRTVPQVKPQRDAVAVGRKAAQRRWTDAHAVGADAVGIGGEKIPRHAALLDDAAPLQRAVRTLPVVAEDAQRLAERGVPAQQHIFNRVGAGGDEHVRDAVVWLVGYIGVQTCAVFGDDADMVRRSVANR